MTPISRPARGRFPHVLVAAAAAGLVAVSGCGGPAQPAASAGTASPAAAAAPAPGIDTQGTLATDGAAITYNPAVAPVGARLAVHAEGSPTATTVRLQVSGLLPNRGYAAHVHQLPCGPTGAAAGPHHQHQVDPAATPEKPSADPAFANPQNEIWLDMRTDAAGAAEVSSDVPFSLADRRPASVILHEAERTATEPGKAGTAGARVACLSVPFTQLPVG